MPIADLRIKFTMILQAFIYEKIFASPASVVIDVLRKHVSLSEMWPNLPRSLNKEDPE